MTKLRPIPTILSVLALGAFVPAAAQAATCVSSTQAANGATVTQQVCSIDITVRTDQPWSGTVGTYRLTSTTSDNPLSDPDVAENAQINWDDGTTDSGLLAWDYKGDATIRGTHAYASPGLHHVTVTATTSGTYRNVALNLFGSASNLTMVTPPPPAYLTTSGTPATRPGVDFTLRVVAHNADGSVDTAYDDPSPTWGDLYGVLAPQAPAPFVDGVSTTVAHFTGPARPDYIVISSYDNQASTHGFVVVGPLDHFAVSKPSAPHAGRPFNLTVAARDAVGNTVRDYAGTPALTDDTRTLAATLGAFSHGIATATDATIRQPAKVDHLTVSDGTASSSSTAFAVVGDVDHFAVSVKQPVAPNQDTTLTIRALDVDGLTVTDYAGSPSLADDRGVLSATPAAFANGVSTTTDAQFSAPEAGDRVTVADGSARGASTRFNVVGPLDHFAISVPSSIPVGASFFVALRALDAAGNLVKSYAGGATIADDSGQAQTSGLPFLNGTSSVSLSIAAAERGDHLTATDPSSGSQTTSRAFDVIG